MYFPDEIKRKIISFIPKYFKINCFYKNTELHYLAFEKNTYSIFRLKEIINQYSLKQNNYLQNSYGHTPLHVAYQFSNYKFIEILEKKCPEMKNIKSLENELPIQQKDIYNLTRREHEC